MRFKACPVGWIKGSSWNWRNLCWTTPRRPYRNSRLKQDSRILREAPLVFAWLTHTMYIYTVWCNKLVKGSTFTVFTRFSQCYACLVFRTINVCTRIQQFRWFVRGILRPTHSLRICLSRDSSDSERRFYLPSQLFRYISNYLSSCLFFSLFRLFFFTFIWFSFFYSHTVYLGAHSPHFFFILSIFCFFLIFCWNSSCFNTKKNKWQIFIWILRLFSLFCIFFLFCLIWWSMYKHCRKIYI